MKHLHDVLGFWLRPRGRLFRLPALVLTLGLSAAALAACGSEGVPPANGETAQAEGGGSAGGDEQAGEETELVILDSVAVRLGGIEVGIAEAITARDLPVTGTITYDANRVSHIGARTEGRVVGLRADLGTRARRGQVLVELESAEVGQIRAEEHEAEALLGIAQENYAREQRLEQQGISSRKEYLAAQADLRRAEASLKSARERLRVMGAGHGEGGHFDIVAPFAGVVVARDVSLGEPAGPADTLLTLADLSRVWIELDIFERDLARVRVGQPVAVSVTAYPGRAFPGAIVYVGDVLDPQKRTVRARVEIPNADGALKPGMFATARIRIGSGGPPLAVVPQDAVQNLDGRTVVFVPGDSAGEFRPVTVEVGETVDGDRVVIRTGLSPGSRVVVAGAFALRSELAKGEIGEHGH